MNVPFPPHTPPNELYVVGEHASDPMKLLLQGTDGNFYSYALPEGNPEPVEIDDDWTVETDLGEEILE
ncbi:MAG: hypothetical protein ACR2OE_16750 [Thermomicrobiales bacterium]